MNLVIPSGYVAIPVPLTLIEEAEGIVTRCNREQNQLENTLGALFDRAAIERLNSRRKAYRAGFYQS